MKKSLKDGVNIKMISRHVLDTLPHEGSPVSLTPEFPAGTWYWDIPKDAFYFPDAIYSLLGWKRDKMGINLERFLQAIHPEDRASVKAAIDKALYEKYPLSIEHRILLKDGSSRAVHTQAQISTDEQERPVNLVGTIHDVTKIGQVEKELAYRLEFEDTLITLSTQFIKLSVSETDSAINDALRIIGTFAGFDRSYIFQFSEDLARMDNTHEWCAEGIEGFKHRMQGLKTDQFQWWMERMARFETICIPSVEGLPPEADAERREFQRQGIQSLIGVPMVSDNTLLGFVGFDAVRKKRECLDDIINLLKIVGEIFINALERKRQHEATLSSESKLNAMLSSIGDCMCMMDRDYTFTWANDAMLQQFGEDIVGRRCYEIFHHREEPCKPCACATSQTFKDGKIHFGEPTATSNDGHVRYYHVTSNVALRDEKGEPGAVILVGRDITAQKQAETALLEARRELEQRVKQRTADLIAANKQLQEEVFVRKQIEKALRESEERFRSQYKGMPLPTYTWQKVKDSFDFMLIDYNDAAYETTEGGIIHYLGVKASQFYQDMPFILDDMQRCYSQRSSFQKEMTYRFRYKEKTGQFLASYAFVPPDLVLVHAEDITDRKRAEEELRLKDKAIGSSLNAFAIADLDGHHTYVNNAFLRLWGYKDEREVLGRKTIEFLHDKKMEGEAAKSLRKTGSWSGELVAVRKDGSLFDVFVSASIVTDEADNPICVMASFADITERKQAEKQLAGMCVELEKSRDDMLSILNMLRMGTAITDREGRIKFLSQTAQRIVGTSQKEASGRHWAELFPVREEERAQLRHLAAQRPESRKKLQIHFETPEGKQYWIDIEVQDEPRNPDRKILLFYDMSEIYDLRRMLDEKVRFHDLTGRSDQMRMIYQQIQEISSVDWTVLIEGETGTGKELVARAIHYSSPRKDKPFVPVNCAGLTDSLLTSQLFGHKRGAFTGAIEDHIGLFEAANGGTIFLDEIGDISLNVQTNLLRVLEAKEITRVGESKSKKINVRIIAATHKSLTAEVESGRFRPDLFYRIRVARIKIPPLRQRKEDIPLLAETFLGQCRAITGKSVQEIGNEVMRIFMEYDWPGNVRELKSAIEFAVTHCKRSIIELEDIPPEIREPEHSRPLFKEIKESERERILLALRDTKGNRKRAAQSLGISRATFYRRLTILDIDVSKE
ncbi:MAG: sigma 54-interacting transcriptional regulator [bacterium]